MKNKKQEYFYLGLFGSLFVASFVLITAWAITQMSFNDYKNGIFSNSNEKDFTKDVSLSLKTSVVSGESDFEFSGHNATYLFSAGNNSDQEETQPSFFNLNLAIKRKSINQESQLVSGFMFESEEIPAYLKFKQFNKNQAISGWQCNDNGDRFNQGSDASLRIACVKNNSDYLSLEASPKSFGFISFEVPLLTNGSLSVDKNPDPFSFLMHFSKEGTPTVTDFGFQKTINIYPINVDVDSFSVVPVGNSGNRNFFFNWELSHSIPDNSPFPGFYWWNFIEITDIENDDVAGVVFLPPTEIGINDRHISFANRLDLEKATFINIALPSGVASLREFFSRETSFHFNLISYFSDNISGSVQGVDSRALYYGATIEGFEVRESSQSSTVANSLLIGDKLKFNWNISLKEDIELTDIGGVALFRGHDSSSLESLGYGDVNADFPLNSNSDDYNSFLNEPVYLDSQTNTFTLEVFDTSGAVLDSKEFVLSAQGALVPRVTISDFSAVNSSGVSVGLEEGDQLFFNWRVNLENLTPSQVGAISLSRGNDIIYFQSNEGVLNLTVNEINLRDFVENDQDLLARNGVNRFTLEVIGLVDEGEAPILATRNFELDVESNQVATDCSDLFMGLAGNRNVFGTDDLVRLQELFLEGVGIEAGIDANQDGRFSFADVVSGMQCFVCLWDWNRYECMNANTE